MLWLLPLAAFARPRWRDLVIWQACELFYFFAVWMHLANFFVAPGPCRISSHLISASGCDWVYSLSILIRVAGQLYLAVLIVRDILDPSRDPVRADGHSDDPLGGVLDTGIDASPLTPQPPGDLVPTGGGSDPPWEGDDHQLGGDPARPD